MDLVNFILNVAGVLLWIDWRSGRALGKRLGRPSISITNSVRPADPRRWRGWRALSALAALLGLRAVFYWNIGAAVNWIPRTDLVAISIPWRSDSLQLMLIYSLVSFGSALGIFYSWLLLLSALHGRMSDSDAVQRVLRLQLGFLDRLPAVVKVLLPPVGIILLWAGIAPFLARWGMIPGVNSTALLWRQAAVLSLAVIEIWKWLLVAFYTVHFVNLYVFLGTHPIWNYVSVTSSKILRPVSFLRFGKLDLSPLLGIAGVLALTRYVVEPVIRMYFFP